MIPEGHLIPELKGFRLDVFLRCMTTLTMNGAQQHTLEGDQADGIDFSAVQ